MQNHRSRKKQLPNETRRIIISKYEAGRSYHEIKEALEIGYETVRSVVNTYLKTGRVDAIEVRRAKFKKITIVEETFIKEKIASDVSITLKEIKRCLLIERGCVVSISTIERAIKKFNYSLKRVVLVPVARNAEVTIEKRFVYANQYLMLDEEKCIFLDEFGVNCSMRLGYGRSERGTQARKIVRSIRSKNYSICAAISKSGLILYHTKNCPYNGVLFREFLNNLVNKLGEKKMYNCTIIMDNVAFHKVAGIREILEEHGHNILFLPPYSPQLNPIEEFFSKWKHYIRLSNPETVIELENSIFSGCNLFTENDCFGFLLDVRRFALKAIRRDEF
jgi:transposase